MDWMLIARIVAIWAAVSVPLGILVGKFIALSRTEMRMYEDMLDDARD